MENIIIGIVLVAFTIVAILVIKQLREEKKSKELSDAISKARNKDGSVDIWHVEDY